MVYFYHWFIGSQSIKGDGLEMPGGGAFSQ